MILGILGGIGAGKSEVTRLFVERGHRAIDADRLGHEVLREPAVIEKIRQDISDEVFDSDGQVIRGELGKRVFARPELLERLNGITHPRIEARMEALIDEHLRESAPRGEILVIDAALLDRLSSRDRCDGMIFVDTPLETREKRCQERGWPPGELRRRESLQTPLETRRALARWVIDNSGTREQTREQVAAILDELESSRSREPGEP